MPSVSVGGGSSTGQNVFSSILTTTNKNHLVSDATLDGVNKIRVSTPQTLIDTDFEYGLQPTKWETLETVSNIPTFFRRDGDESIDISDITTVEGDITVRVTTAMAHNLFAGSPIIVIGSNSYSANGSFVVSKIVSSTVFLYRATYPQKITGSIYEITTTFIYPGRLFQGIYIQKDARDIVTDGQSPLSKLTVETGSAHGLAAGTMLILSNSNGDKKITFEAANVVYADTTNANILINALTVPPNSSGYLSRSVVPYDFLSKKTVFFNSSNVIPVSNVINVPSHGLISNTYVMYTKPVGDVEVGGLSDFSMYKVLAPDTGNISLYPVKSITTDNLIWKKEFNTAIVTNDSNKVLLELRENSPLTTNLASAISYTSPGGQFSSYLEEYTGFLKASGSTFSLNATVESIGRISVWVGKRAIRNTQTNYNILVVNDGAAADGSPAPSTTVEDADDPSSQYTHTLKGTTSSQTVTFNSTAGVYYPVRIRIYVGTKNKTVSLSVTGATLAYQQMNQDISAITPSTVANITSTGTDTYGYHALHKVYPVKSLTTVSDTISLDTDIGTTDAPLVVNDKMTIFSDGFGLSDAFISKNHVSVNDYTSYQISTVSSGNIVVDNPTSQLLNLTTSNIEGLTWMVPKFQIPEYDSFYYPGHGIQENANITPTVLSGTAPSGLVSGTSYKAEFVTEDYFRIKTNDESSRIDIKTVGNANISIVYSTTLTTKNSIVVSGHNLLNGDSVVYNNEGEASIPGLVSGNTYVVSNSTSSSFKLQDPGTLSEIDLTGNSSNIHSFTASGALDGSYSISQVVSDNIFNINTGFAVPPREISIHNRKNILLNSDNIYVDDHNLNTGSKVRLYESNISNASTYYTIRTDINHIKLASSYDNSQIGTSISLAPFASNIHTMLVDSVVSLKPYTAGNVILTANSSLVTCSNVNFLALERVGDSITFEVPKATTSFTVSSVDTATDVITLNAAHTLANGNPLFYDANGTSVAGLTDGFVYYVRAPASTTIQLFNTYNDALTNTSVVNLTDSVAGNYGTFLRRNFGTVFNRTVSEIHNTTNLTVDTPITESSSVAKYMVKTLLFPRADGFALHRPYDGGVELIPANTPDSKIIRQTRKYFRYQSGKGICVSKAVNFNAPTEIERLTRSGSTATIVTRRPHRLKASTTIKLEGADDPLWDGTYTVSEVVDINTFRFVLSEPLPVDTVVGGFPLFYVTSWSNSSLRVGLFDDQNGMFFEYNGSDIFAVRRNSTLQLFGTASVQFLSKIVSGTSTSYTTQLTDGDFIVIKGQSYKVNKVLNNTTLVISPPYRGASYSGVIITKTIDVRVSRSQWSLDPCDGTGPSGYVFNPRKIQMTYYDYSWYGAGKIRFGFKGSDGKIFYCHEFIHNNNLNEAYFRSGNLPARYEVVSTGNPTYVPALMHWGTSIIMDGLFDDDKAYFFTAAGNTLAFTRGDQIEFAATTTSAQTPETVGETGETGYKVTMDTANFDKVSAVPAGTPISGTGIPAGTITVGTPTKTKNGGYIYISKAVTSTGTNLTLTVGDSSDVIPDVIPLVSIRLSPSVDNGIAGGLGIREIINRMQLILRQVSILTTHDVEITMFLNGIPFYKTFEKVTPPSLSQLIKHTKADTLQGGVELFTFSASGGTANASGFRNGNNTTVVLSELASLGNSILGGDDVFPNGPDLLTITAKVLDQTGITLASPFKISARISWSESQA